MAAAVVPVGRAPDDAGVGSGAVTSCLENDNRLVCVGGGAALGGDAGGVWVRTGKGGPRAFRQAHMGHEERRGGVRVQLGHLAGCGGPSRWSRGVRKGVVVLMSTPLCVYRPHRVISRGPAASRGLTTPMHEPEEVGGVGGDALMVLVQAGGLWRGGRPTGRKRGVLTTDHLHLNDSAARAAGTPSNGLEPRLRSRFGPTRRTGTLLSRAASRRRRTCRVCTVGPIMVGPTATVHFRGSNRYQTDRLRASVPAHIHLSPWCACLGRPPRICNGEVDGPVARRRRRVLVWFEQPAPREIFEYQAPTRKKM